MNIKFQMLHLYWATLSQLIISLLTKSMNYNYRQIYVDFVSVNIFSRLEYSSLIFRCVLIKNEKAMIRNWYSQFLSPTNHTK